MAAHLENEPAVQREPTIDVARAPRPPKRRRRTAGLFAVDAVLFAVFLAVVNVPLTGLAVHEWLGIFIGVGFTIHLLQHGEWIVTTTRRFMTASSLQNRFNYLLMIGLFVGSGCCAQLASEVAKIGSLAPITSCSESSVTVPVSVSGSLSNAS